jgi:hypothetical protein
MSTIYSPPFVSGAIGDQLFFFITGTSTPQNTYTDPDLNTAHSNPVEADAEGNFETIFFDPELPAYRVDYKDINGVSYPGYPVDNVPSSQNQATVYLVKGENPTVELWETDATTDNKRWRIRVDGEQFKIEQGTDAGLWTALMTLNRGDVIQESGSFTATLNGVSGTVTGTAYWYRFSDAIIIVFPSFTGTSNTTTKTISGIPSGLRPARNSNVFTSALDDSPGDREMIYGELVANSGNIGLVRLPASATWTPTGTVIIDGFTAVYEVQ